MKIQARITLLCLLILSLSSSAWTRALDSLPPGKWWENERLITAIELTEGQQRSIHEIVYQHAMGMIDLNATLKRAELELEDLVNKPDFDKDAVRKAFHKFQESRQALENSRFEMLLSVRQILSNEQWKKLQQIRRKFRTDNPEMRGARRYSGAQDGGANRRQQRTPRP